MRDEGATLESIRELHEDYVQARGQDPLEGEEWDESSQRAVERWFIAQSLGVEVKPSRKKQRGRGKKKK